MLKAIEVSRDSKPPSWIRAAESTTRQTEVDDVRPPPPTARLRPSGVKLRSVIHSTAGSTARSLWETQRFPEEPKHLQDKDLCVHYFAKKSLSWYAPNIRP